MTPTATRTLSTAEERREALVAAAMRVFAARGMSAPTTDIAKAAGISQAYLFRLFPTKDDLAQAVSERCREVLVRTFRAARIEAEASGAVPKEAMGNAYAALILTDRDILLCQLHMTAAAPDHPALAESMRRTYAAVYDEVAGVLAPEDVTSFFAHGMLINTMVAVGADAIDEPWAVALGSKTDLPS
jgi:AcrR family transcriptional regulator